MVLFHGSAMAKATWFGAAVSRVTRHAAELPSPFPEALQKVLQEHVGKAETARKAALKAIQEVSSNYDEVMKSFCAMELEGGWAQPELIPWPFGC